MKPLSTKIKGIGRNFNAQLGKKAFRTACAISIDTDLESGIAILRRKMAVALADPKSTARLMVQGDRFWFSEATVNEIVDNILIVDREGDGIARAVRFGDGRGDTAMPAAIAVCEPYKGHVRSAADLQADVGAGQAEEGAMTVTWLFRHDVVDGWRVLRFLCSHFLDECPLTFERLRARHDEQKVKARSGGFIRKLLRGAASLCGAAALAPAATLRLGRLAIASNTIGLRRHFYMHAVVSLARMKELASAQRLGGISTVLTACISAAFFAADPTRDRAVVGQNVLFDPDAPEGNHVCVKMASLARPDFSDRSVLTRAAQTMNSSSQNLADVVIGSVTREYVKGSLPKFVDSMIHQRHDAMDFLVSNLPAFDTSSPRVFDLQTLREFTDWAPSIVYVIGVGDDLFCDFYWAVRPSFSTDAFMRTFTSVSGAKDVHTFLADSY